MYQSVFFSLQVRLFFVPFNFILSQLYVVAVVDDLDVAPLYVLDWHHDPHHVRYDEEDPKEEHVILGLGEAVRVAHVLKLPDHRVCNEKYRPHQLNYRYNRHKEGSLQAPGGQEQACNLEAQGTHYQNFKRAYRHNSWFAVVVALIQEVVELVKELTLLQKAYNSVQQYVDQRAIHQKPLIGKLLVWSVFDHGACLSDDRH